MRNYPETPTGLGRPARRSDLSSWREYQSYQLLSRSNPGKFGFYQRLGAINVGSALGLIGTVDKFLLTVEAAAAQLVEATVPPLIPAMEAASNEASSPAGLR